MKFLEAKLMKGTVDSDTIKFIEVSSFIYLFVHLFTHSFKYAESSCKSTWHHIGLHIKWAESYYDHYIVSNTKSYVHDILRPDKRSYFQKDVNNIWE